MKMNSIYASNEEVQPSKQSSSKNETPKKGLTSLSKKKSKNSIRPSASLYDNEQSKHGSISNNLQSNNSILLFILPSLFWEETMKKE